MKINIELAKEILKKLNSSIFLSDLLKDYSQEIIFLHLALYKLDNKILDLVKQDKILLSNAYALTKLPIKIQLEFINDAMTMPAQDFVPKCFYKANE